ncbi:DEAD/DEAH box helicase [Mobiluncus curtisii]|uniref:DEAD/DEAH box helicase n=1 Tax=Mobiluncus curtisii TaxID=2051 RepID=UPI001470659A|nr:DEAD/DEAH box helicase [Mobiluncus curtisii]NMW88065.1 DEAD/DEAH box helicase [Mobiluncus curtisii]
MRYIPHGYQTKALTHILTHPRCALFLDMGLGKTVITLTALKALIATGTTKKALIIAPKRVALTTWPDEIQKWDHTRTLDYALIVGGATKRSQALESPAPIHIINRENIPWLCKTVPEWSYDTVVIDELSSFKNPTALRFRALKKRLSHIQRIIGLTGTPAPNGLIDLWAQYKLVDGGQALGNTLTAYRGRWFHAQKYLPGIGPVDWQPNHGAEQEIYQALAPTTLSMQAADHLQLPPCTITSHNIDLPAKPQNGAAFTPREKYDQLKQNMVADIDLDTIEAANAAVLVAKLQQLTSGAIYIQKLFDNDTDCFQPCEQPEEVAEIHDAKLDALEDIIEAANGQPVLIAYWYKHELWRIQHRFPAAQEINTPESIRDWNQQKTPIALIHPASAGHGLNLQTGGHFLVWYTPIWNLELYQQTNARLYRQGQQHPVTISHIIARDTIDERIMQNLQTKDHTQNRLVQALKQELGEKQ